jgi:mRNA deadenylase 3'-5' endonuclease subunit Ccr4
MFTVLAKNMMPGFEGKYVSGVEIFKVIFSCDVFHLVNAAEEFCGVIDYIFFRFIMNLFTETSCGLLYFMMATFCCDLKYRLKYRRRRRKI